MTWPKRVDATSLMPNKATSRSSSKRSTLGMNPRPAWVRLTLRVVRSKSLTPRASSSFSMRRLSAGCDRRTVSAALRKLPCSTTARKACRSLRSKLMAMAGLGGLICRGYECNQLMPIIIETMKISCRSEPARDSGESVDLCVADTPISRAGSLLQGIFCGYGIAVTLILVTPAVPLSGVTIHAT
ncbi:hypothetical protein D3C72_416250 [compost metagenome]